MKITGNIFLTSMALLFTSCILEYNKSDTPDILPTRGVMQVEIVEQEGEAEDKLKTVRFFVFKDASVNPTLELNELFDIPAIPPGESEVSKFRIILETSRNLQRNDDKMIVAIVNEPYTMKSNLDAITDYNSLQNMQLVLTDFLKADHTELQDDKTLPMTGVVWTDKVYATPSEAETDPAQINIQRALARVDIYIRKAVGVEVELGFGTNISLNNTYNSQYLVRNQDGINIFGKIQTVTSGFITKSWALAISEILTIPEISASNNGRFVCSFYTPERTCVAINNTDKLVLNIITITTEGTTRSAEVIIDKFRLNGTETDIYAITRNNMYRVIITIGDHSITATVLHWREEDIHTEL